MKNWRNKLAHWWSSQSTLSAYLDLELSSGEHRRVWRHLARCADCREELAEMSGMREDLRATDPVRDSVAVPEDLAFNIKLRLAQERYRAQRPSLWWRLRMRLQPFAGQALTGVVSAVLAFTIFLPNLAVPMAAYKNDVPINWSTPAKLVDMGPADLVSDPGNIVVQVLVDNEGRVADYSILSGHYTPEDIRELRNRLTFTIFDPATVHGRPTYELQFIAFNSVRVRG
jgi:hypothetical protein